jgi:hypothetical protein
VVFERVHTFTDYYDGPREGIADLGGAAHYYKAEWDTDRDDYADTFLLTPVDSETLVLALEDWAIWERWQEAFHEGHTDRATHPALPRDRPRHEEIQRLLAGRFTADPDRAIRKRGEFRVRADAGESVLEVRWYDPA